MLAMFLHNFMNVKKMTSIPINNKESTLKNTTHVNVRFNWYDLVIALDVKWSNCTVILY